MLLYFENLTCREFHNITKKTSSRSSVGRKCGIIDAHIRIHKVEEGTTLVPPLFTLVPLQDRVRTQLPNSGRVGE